MQLHFHKNCFALRLAVKQKHKGTRKWSIEGIIWHSTMEAWGVWFLLTILIWKSSRFSPIWSEIGYIIFFSIFELWQSPDLRSALETSSHFRALHAPPPVPFTLTNVLPLIYLDYLTNLGVASFLLPLIVCKSDPHIVAMRTFPSISPDFNLGIATTSLIRQGSTRLPRNTILRAVPTFWDMASKVYHDHVVERKK